MQLVYILLRVCVVFEDKDCVTINAFRDFFYSETTILVTYTLHTYNIKLNVTRTNSFIVKMAPASNFNIIFLENFHCYESET